MSSSGRCQGAPLAAAWPELSITWPLLRSLGQPMNFNTIYTWIFKKIIIYLWEAIPDILIKVPLNFFLLQQSTCTRFRMRLLGVATSASSHLCTDPSNSEVCCFINNIDDQGPLRMRFLSTQDIGQRLGQTEQSEEMDTIQFRQRAYLNQSPVSLSGQPASCGKSQSLQPSLP